LNFLFDIFRILFDVAAAQPGLTPAVFVLLIVIRQVVRLLLLLTIIIIDTEAVGRPRCVHAGCQAAEEARALVEWVEVACSHVALRHGPRHRSHRPLRSMLAFLIQYSCRIEQDIVIFLDD